MEALWFFEALVYNKCIVQYSKLVASYVQLTNLKYRNKILGILYWGGESESVLSVIE